MEIVWVSPGLLLLAGAILWRNGITGDSRTIAQGLLVVYAAILVSGSYLSLKLRLEREPDFFEKFWISLPLLASFVVTGRCVFGRIIRLLFRSRRFFQSKKEV